MLALKRNTTATALLEAVVLLLNENKELALIIEVVDSRS
jgi:hypothetical protein